MEHYNNFDYNNQNNDIGFKNQIPQKLPNATAVLILGIASIVLCLCYGIGGLIAGIVAIILYNKDKKMYKLNPTAYSNYGTLNTGYILTIVGMIMSIVYIIFTIIIISLIGFDALQDSELSQQRLQELIEQMKDAERENF